MTSALLASIKLIAQKPQAWHGERCCLKVGVIAGDFKDRELKWDSDKLTFDHVPATALVCRRYREGWDVVKQYLS